MVAKRYICHLHLVSFLPYLIAYAYTRLISVDIVTKISSLKDELFFISIVCLLFIIIYTVMNSKV